MVGVLFSIKTGGFIYICTHVHSLYAQRIISVNRVMLRYYPQVSFTCISVSCFWLFSDLPVFSDMGKPFGAVMFHCRHMFHRECLPSSGGVVCDFVSPSHSWHCCSHAHVHF